MQGGGPCQKIVPSNRDRRRTGATETQVELSFLYGDWDQSGDQTEPPPRLGGTKNTTKTTEENVCHLVTVTRPHHAQV